MNATVNYLQNKRPLKRNIGVDNPVKGVKWRGEKKVAEEELVQGGQVLFYLLLTQLSNLQQSVARPVLGIYMEGRKVCPAMPTRSNAD